jgi:hypothetical protein
MVKVMSDVFDLTPVEARYFRRFFRRMALRYSLGILVLGGVLVFVFADPSESVEQAAAPVESAESALPSIDLTDVRAEVKRLLAARPATVPEHKHRAPAADANLASENLALRTRVEVLLRRVEALEARPVAEPVPAAMPAPPLGPVGPPEGSPSPFPGTPEPALPAHP